MKLNSLSRQSGQKAWQRSVRLPLMLAAILGVAMTAAKPASAYTPEDPVVQGMVNRGVSFLEALSPDKFKGVRADLSTNCGEVILLGYAHHKCRHDPDARLVKDGLAMAEAVTNTLNNGQGDNAQKKVYVIAVCVLLFAEVDAERYDKQLRDLQKHLFDAQPGHGGWTYPGFDEGDISQVQYALLAIWVLDRAGIALDYDRVVNSLQWLLRVQSTNGGWPYHGKDPGFGKPLIAQPKVGMSMTLAGGSSILIAGDALRLWGDTADDTDPGIPGLPEAIKLYKEDKNTNRRRRVQVSAEPIRRALVGLEQYRRTNPYKRSGLDWYYYQLYTLERFESFVEISQGKVKDKSPAWYNQGVDELRKYQGADGGWSDRSHTLPHVSTAFALLFLIRSTQKSVFNMGAGALSGGWGLPKDTTDIRVDGTQIKGRPIAADISNMLDILEKDGGGDTEGKSLPDDLTLATDPTARKAQLDRLERLIRGSKSWQARRVAARLLGTSDELRVVPALIFALSDPDPEVWRFARDGLRFISRKFDGMGLDAPPPGQDVHSPAMVDQAQKKWRDWYRTMNPKFVFIDYDL